MITDNLAFEEALREYDKSHKPEPTVAYNLTKENERINEEYYNKVISILENAIKAKEGKYEG